jgi:hypothetical protein
MSDDKKNEDKAPAPKLPDPDESVVLNLPQGPDLPSATGEYKLLSKAMDDNIAGTKEARSSVQRLLNALGIAPRSLKTPKKP